MDEGQEPQTIPRNMPALACSGGGFRATLYHCGATKRLNELGYLTKLSRISSVSGGSITTGMLAARWTKLKRNGDVFTNLDDEVITPLRDFCTRRIDRSAIAWGAMLPGKSIGDMLTEAYDDLFGGVMLADLPQAPQFAFNATNLQTGRVVRMMKTRLADYTIGEIVNPTISLARAVAASSAFPPVLSPVDIHVDSSTWTNRKGTLHFGDPAYTKVLSLTDGGAYDNLGLETVDDFNPVIVSDAGAPFGVESEVSSFWPTQALRALDIATDQARSLRKRLLHAECQRDGRRYAYAGIDCDPADFDVSKTSALKAKKELTAELARMRTRLNPFTEKEQSRLINWGWLMMDFAMRTHITPDAPPPSALPLPDFPLG